MADSKISALSAGSTAAATDRLPAARAGTNVYLTPLDLFALFNMFNGTNIVEQRNGTNQQFHNLYGTYTDGSNYERLAIFASGGAGGYYNMKSEQAGTGVRRSWVLSGQEIFFNTGSDATRWNINPSGHFLANTDNSFDIGAASATRPRVGYSSSGWLVTGTGTAGVGYGTGAGGAVTQATSRTTGVTLNKLTGGITLFTAAGSATPASFTVTNSTVATTDAINLSIKSATNKYAAIVTAVAAGSFEVTFWSVSGTSSDAPVINFTVVKGVAA